MQDPLREIFEIYEERIRTHPMTSEDQAVWDRAQAVLGVETIDELICAQSRSLLDTEYDYFREGFLLGTRLMMELK